MGILIDCFIVRHPDARSLSHAIGAACLPVGRGYTLQAPSFKFWQFIPSAASGGFPFLSLAGQAPLMSDASIKISQ